jgi:SAM-dependent methyltransferase
MNDPEAERYNALPYPSRDPADEKKRLIAGSPSHVLEIDHCIYGGRRDWTQPFRALVAGGGTGDATVMLTQQLADARCPAEIVHLDLSQASGDIARARVTVRGLKNVRFVTGAIEELAALRLGRFDYIDCCGVLHHLADPERGLRILGEQLSDDGGIGLMVYAPMGRTGVYHLQPMLRLIAGNDPWPERVSTAKKLVAQLPDTNWFKKNIALGDHLLGDAGIADLLLPARDRPYAIVDFVRLIDGGGLRLASLVTALRYEPALYLRDADLLARLAKTQPLERAAFTELLAGNMRTHVAYAVKAANKAQTVAIADTPAAVPVLREPDDPMIAAARGAPAGQTIALAAQIDGYTVRIALPALGPAILARIDGRASIAAIFAACEGAASPAPDWPTFKRDFDRLFTILNGLNKLFLRRPRA